MTRADARSAAPQRPADLSLTLDDLLENGQGVGRIDGMVAFVTGGLPGERVRIAIDARKRKYVSAHATEIEQPSPDRIASICPVFPVCGGCQVLHLAYVAQLAWKRRLVSEALARLGGLQGIQVDEVVATAASSGAGYRNKVSLVTQWRAGAMRLGFYAARSHRVVPIERCPVLLPQLDAAVSRLVEFARDAPQAFSGTKHVVARTSATHPRLAVAFNGDAQSKSLGALSDELRQRLPQLTGLVNSWELDNENALFGTRVATLWGSPALEETVAGATLRFGIASFFQINTAILELIAQDVIRELTGAGRVVDLYCGVGTFGVILGVRGIATTGVEWFKPAFDECAANAASNGVVNAAFEHAGASEAVSGERGRTLLRGADAVILDPPRKGCEPLVLEALASNGVPRILYISCNPATLARDAKLLVEQGYRLERVTPYDMFPQTGHVEAIAVFAR